MVEEWKTNLMSLAILFHVLCAQHVSDINISIIRSLRLCCWITTLVVLFSVRCVLEIWCGWFCASACKTNTTKYQPQQKLQHTTNWEQDDRCGNSSTKSQAPEDGYINVRNMLRAHNKWNKIASDIKLVFHSVTLTLWRSCFTMCATCVFWR